MRPVVLLVEHDASQRLIDPVWPLVETLVCQLALLKELVSVDGHNRFGAWMAQYERKDRHFKEFFFRFLAFGRGANFARRRCDH